MSNPLNIYVFTNGEAVTQVFNAVAAMVGSSSMDGFYKAFEVALLFSGAGAISMYLKERSLTVFLKWVGIYFAIMIALFSSTVTVDIHNESDPAFVPRVVDNVPLGVALPAWLSSTLSVGLTQIFEDIFHTPDDVSYSKTGMIYGARLFHTVNTVSTLASSQLKGEMDHFVSQCIVPDVMLNHKYTFGEVEKTPDIFRFLSNQTMSPLRGIYMSSGFVTCAKALPLIKKAFNTQLNAQGSLIGNIIFGKNAPPSGKMFTQIANVNQYMMGMSQSAQSYLVQNTMINAIRNGLDTEAAKNNELAAMINFGTTKAMQKQIISDNVIKRFGAYMIPMTQTILFMLLVALFPLICLMALQPMMFGKMVKHYFNAFLTISTWPILYTVINFFITSTLSSHMTSLYNINGGLTLSNQNELQYQASLFASDAGYYLAMIPVLSVFLFRGLDSAIMYSSQALFGNMNSSVAASTGGMDSGDINMGNTSIDNHSMNNMNGNKWDTNSSVMAGAHSMQQMNGSTLTRTANGQMVYNTAGGMSQLASSVNMGQTLGTHLSQQATAAHNAAMSHRDSFDQSVSNASSQAYNWSKTHGTNESYGDSHTMTDATSNNQALSNMSSLAQEYAQAHNVSMQQSFQDLTSLAAEGTAGFNSDHEVVGKAASLLTGVSAKGSITGAGKTQSAHDDSDSSSASSSASSRMVDEYRQNLDYVQSHASTMSADSGHSASDSVAQSIGNDFRQAQSSAQQYSADMSASQGYQNMASFSEQNNASIGNNYSQEFADYVGKVDPANAQNILSNTNNPVDTADRMKLAQSFVQEHAGQMEASIANAMNQVNPNSFFQAGQQGVADMGVGADSSNPIFQSSDSGMSMMGQADGMKFNEDTSLLNADSQNLDFNKGLHERFTKSVEGAQQYAQNQINTGLGLQDGKMSHAEMLTRQQFVSGGHAASRGAFMGAGHAFASMFEGHDAVQTSSFLEQGGKAVDLKGGNDGGNA